MATPSAAPALPLCIPLPPFRATLSSQRLQQQQHPMLAVPSIFQKTLCPSPNGNQRRTATRRITAAAAAAVLPFNPAVKRRREMQAP